MADGGGTAQTVVQWDLRGSQGGDGDGDASSGDDAIIFVDDMTRDGVREKMLGLHVLKPDNGVSGNSDSTNAAVRDAPGMVPHRSKVQNMEST